MNAKSTLANDNITKTDIGPKNSAKRVTFEADAQPSGRWFRVALTRYDEPPSAWVARTEGAKCAGKHWSRDRRALNSDADVAERSGESCRLAAENKTRRLVAVRVARCRPGLVLKSREFVLFSVESDRHFGQTKKPTCRQTADTNFPSKGSLEGENGENSRCQDVWPNLPDLIYEVQIDETKLEAQAAEAESELRQPPRPSIDSAQLSDANGAVECFLCECKFSVPLELRSHSGGKIKRKWFCSQCQCLVERVRQRQKLALVRRKRYPCLICKSDFAQLEYMWAHTARCHGLPLECAKCAEYFISVADRANHSKTCHGSAAPTEKNAVAKLNQPKRLKRCKKPKNYKCAICGNEYDDRLPFADHIREHEKWLTHRCTLCSCAFLSRIYLKCHMGLVHCRAQYRCSQCARKFRTRLHLLRHLRSRHPVAKLRCRCSGRLQRAPALSQRGKFFKKTSYCAKCGSCESSKSRKTTSKRRRRKIPSNQNEVGANFVQPQNAKVAQFRCSRCSREFTYKSQLQRHSRIHKRRRGLRCGLCERRFPNKIILRRHIAGHLEIETFQCAHCDRAFSQRSRLETHLKMEHPDSEAKCSSRSDGFICEKCGLTFGQKKKLTRHLAQYGTEYLFDSFVGCSAIKREKSEVKRNYEGGDDGAFTCGLCQHSFETKVALQLHLPTHNRQIDSV